MRSFCRICCLEGLDHNAVSLDHRSEISSKTVLNMLRFVTGLKAQRGDDLPQQICRMCFGQLLISYELKRTSIASQSHFRKLLAERFESEPPGADQEASEPDDEVMHFCCLEGACTEFFKDEDQLVAHFDLIHKETKDQNEVLRTTDNKFVCNICACGFDDEEQLVEHSLLVKRKALKCDICPFVTYSQAEYKFHSRSHHTTSFRCVCGFSSNRKYSLQRHLANMCCEEIYGLKPSRESIRSHRSRLKRAPKEMPLLEGKCDITNDELIALDFSVVHIRHPGKSYCCISECQDAHDSELQCIQHYEETHATKLHSVKDEPDEEEALKCRICRKVFQVEKDLQIHREESFQPLFQCNTCGDDGFRRETALAHSQKPCIVKRFSCPCGFLTNEPLSLNTHFNSGACNRSLDMSDGIEEEVPTEVSPVANAAQEDSNPSPSMEQQSSADRYVCEYCDVVKETAESFRNHQQFEKRRTLRQQTAFDSGREVDGVPGKMYNCKWCNQPTNNVAHLIQCMVNAKEKLRCKKCRMQFDSQGRLKLHDMHGCGSKAVEAKSVRCPYCERRFFYSSSLERHITMDHRVDWKLRNLDPKRKFVCKICGYRFRRKFCMERHTLVHNRKP